MRRESGDQEQKHPGGIGANILGKPSSLKGISKQENTKCQVYDCEIHKLVASLADVATGIWRIRNKFSAVDIDGLPDEIKKAYRHVESTWDALTSAKVEVRDHSKEKYVAGMALNVIAFSLLLQSIPR